MAEVFISYPRLERAGAERIKAKLEALGVGVFFDIQGMDAGVVFPDALTKALDTAKAVIACCSPLYFTRPWCLIEAREGHARQILVPVILDKFERTTPPVDLRHVNYLNLSDWTGADGHEDWGRTLRALARHLGREISASKGFDAAAVAAAEAAARREAVERSRKEAEAERQVREEAAAEARRKEEARKADEQRVLSLRSAAEAAQKAEELRRRIEMVDRDGSLQAEAWSSQAEGQRFRLLQERAFPIELPGVANWPNPQMIAIPPGRFLMGAPNGEQSSADMQRPLHEVRIDYTFALGRHTVTFAEWDAAVAAGAKLEKPGDEGWGRGNRPVINVNWEDAQAYLAWLNDKTGLTGRPDAYRLPSEAEWEYACRAGTTTPFSFGITISTAQANYHGYYVYGAGKEGEFREKTAPAGSFPANAFGLHDMHGNVWEWCQDCWNGNYTGAPLNGSAWITGDCSSRVVRGGSWGNVPAALRSATRSSIISSNRYGSIGFRLACTL